MKRIAATAMICFIVFIAPFSSQDVPVSTLTQPIASFHHGFTRVEGIRELNDGRVIVLDVSDRTVHVIDVAWTEIRQIGRWGDGPAEYRTPTKLFALPGDSSAVLDQQNARMLVITPDANPGDFLNPMGAAGRSVAGYSQLRETTAGINLHGADATDGSGYYYARSGTVAVSSSGELQLVDSAAIERWTYVSPKRDTIGYVHYPSRAGCDIVGGMAFCPVAEKPRAFVAANLWAIGPDGRLAVVYHDPYRVKFHDPAGSVRSGQPIPYEPVLVTEAHKRQWRDERRQTRQALVVTNDGRSGTAPLTPKSVEPEWPKYLPPYLYSYRYSAVRFASDGMLWVLRTTAVGEPPTIDTIDESGQVSQNVKLPHNSRVVGFGKGSVYVVRIDEVDLEYLEKYELPSAGQP